MQRGVRPTQNRRASCRSKPSRSDLCDKRVRCERRQKIMFSALPNKTTPQRGMKFQDDLGEIGEMNEKNAVILL